LVEDFGGKFEGLGVISPTLWEEVLPGLATPKVPSFDQKGILIIKGERYG